MPSGHATVTQCVVQIEDGQPAPHKLLRDLSRFGVTDALLLTGHVPTVPALPRPMRIAHAAPPPGAGSGGALFHVRDQLRDRFLLCAANAGLDWNLALLLAAAAADGPEIVGRLVRPDPGIALFRRSLAHHLRPACSLETDVLPDLASQDLLRTTGRAGTSPDARARNALFLDRDGVLNIDHGYVGSRDRFEWTPGALDAIRHATNTGWHVFVVTNQSGVARGLYTEDAVRHLLDWMADKARMAGGTIDDTRFCPYHPEAPLDAYRQAHPWRKPLPGMLLDLIAAWNLDPKRAVMIGDQDTDMRAAAAAGVAGHLFPGGNLLDFLKPILDRHP